MLTDQAALLSLPEFERRSPTAVPFFISAGFTLWFFWQLGSAIGVFLGVRLPESWSLDFAVPLSFLAMLIPAIKGKPTAIAAFTAAVAILVTRFLPLNLGLIAAALVGVCAGLFSEKNL